MADNGRNLLHSDLRMTRSLPYVALLATCICSCATSPAGHAWLCGSYESPPRTFHSVREDGQRETWEVQQCLSLDDDWTCCLSYGSGFYPIGRWNLETTIDGSMRVQVWPGSLKPIEEPELILFAVLREDGRVVLVRDGEVWTRRWPPAR